MIVVGANSPNAFRTVVLKAQTQCLDPPPKFDILVLQPKSYLKVWQPLALLIIISFNIAHHIY